jgi:hypothetical protein
MLLPMISLTATQTLQGGRVEFTGRPMKAMAFGLLGIRVYQDRCGCFDEVRAVLRSSPEGRDNSPLRHCLGGAGH